MGRVGEGNILHSTAPSRKTHPEGPVPGNLLGRVFRIAAPPRLPGLAAVNGCRVADYPLTRAAGGAFAPAGGPAGARNWHLGEAGATPWVPSRLYVPPLDPAP